MEFAAAADRVRNDFTEMPRLELTIGQAVRLWNVGLDDCRYLLDELVDAGFLRWTAQRTIVRADNDVRDRDSHVAVHAYISVTAGRRTL